MHTIRLTTALVAAAVAAAVAGGAGCVRSSGEPDSSAPVPPTPAEVVPKDPSQTFDEPSRKPNPQPRTRNDTVSETAPTRTAVIIETTMGTIKAELWDDKAPITVENFLTYVDATFYDGLIFHRVIKGFMIQGGGFDAGMEQKATREQIKNEAAADKKNDRGTLAMARTGVVDSATSQFFINLVDNGFLNHRDETPQGFGYCAFGKVIEGLDVVDKIGAVATGRAGRYDDVPVNQVQIKSIRRAE